MFSIPFISNTFDHISQAYYSDGKVQLPSSDQISQIAADTASMNLTGKLAMGGGATGVVVSYMIWGIPYVGPLAGLVGMVGSIGIGILGWDMTKASQNLQPFADNKMANSVSNLANSLIQGEKASEQNFKEGVIQTAVKGTIIAKNLVAMSQHQKSH